MNHDQRSDKFRFCLSFPSASKFNDLRCKALPHRRNPIKLYYWKEPCKIASPSSSSCISRDNAITKSDRTIMIRSPSCASFAAALNGLQFGELGCNILLMEAPMVHDILFSLRSLAFFGASAIVKLLFVVSRIRPKNEKNEEKPVGASFCSPFVGARCNNPPMTTAHICSSCCVLTVARASRPSS
jgi:hypothetical protein